MTVTQRKIDEMHAWIVSHFTAICADLESASGNAQALYDAYVLFCECPEPFTWNALVASRQDWEREVNCVPV